MPPWEDPAATTSGFLGTNDDTPDCEISVAIVPPAVTAPLLEWALRTDLDLAPDILTAARKNRRLLDAIPDRAPRGDAESAVAHLRGLPPAGQKLPSGGAPGATPVHTRFGGPLPPMDNTFLAGTLGVRPAWPDLSLLEPRPILRRGLRPLSAHRDAECAPGCRAPGQTHLLSVLRAGNQDVVSSVPSGRPG
ncbi:hypothetical protein GTY54_41645 [Streptomyces sp. SID625]|nr:hypothetical protein [Streptomyces sp. SID625]